MAHHYLAHTADLRAGVSGPDLESLYQSAADLVREILVGDSTVESRQERRLALAQSGGDEGERFFRFVRELLYLYDCEGFLPARVAMARGGGGLTVTGEGFDAARHTSERQVKAVTRHGYRFARAPAGYEAELLFDL